MLIDIDKVIVKERIQAQDKLDVKELAEDIRKHGLYNPLVINGDNVLINGLRRYLACKSLGWQKIDVVVLDVAPEPEGKGIVTSESKLRPRLTWSTSAVRKLLSDPPGKDRKPCFICGKHKSITVLHHIVQISELKKFLNHGLLQADEVSTPVVWLCPNCHTYVHASINGNYDAVRVMQNEEEWFGGFSSVTEARVKHLGKLLKKMELENVG